MSAKKTLSGTGFHYVALSSLENKETIIAQDEIEQALVKCTCIQMSMKGVYSANTCKAHINNLLDEDAAMMQGSNMKFKSQVPPMGQVGDLPPFAAGDEVYIYLPGRAGRAKGKVVDGADYTRKGMLKVKTDEEHLLYEIPSSALELCAASKKSPRYVSKFVSKLVESVQETDITSLVSGDSCTKVDYNDFRSMLEKYTKLIELKCEPDNKSLAIIFVRRSTLFASIGMYQEALKDADDALSLNPELPAAYFRRGYALYGLQEYEYAATSFRQGLQVEPQNVPLMDGLQKSLNQARQYAKQPDLEFDTTQPKSRIL